MDLSYALPDCETVGLVIGPMMHYTASSVNMLFKVSTELLLN